MMGEETYELVEEVESGNEVVEEGSQPLDVDLYCVHCEYNLRGMLPEGTCPECGAVISESLAERTLLFAPREYLEKLRSGLGFLLLMYVCSIVLFVLSIGAGFLGAQAMVRWPVMIVTVLGLVPVLLYAFGTFRVTTPHQYAADAPKSRSVARVAVLTCIATTLLAACLQLFTLSGSVTLGVGMQIVNGGIGIVNNVANLIAAYTLVYYICKFQTGMAFSPHKSYSWLPKFVLITYILPIISGLFVLAIVLISGFGVGAGAPGGGIIALGVIAGLVGLAVGIMFLLAAIFSIILYVKLRRAIGSVITV